MQFLTQPSFWGLLLLGWLISASILSILARYFLAFDGMSRLELMGTVVTIHLLSVLAGFEFSRARCRS